MADRVTGRNMTYHSLCKWFEHVFSKVGWIILKHSEGFHEATHHYLKELSHLDAALSAKHATTVDEDKRRDLEIMRNHLRILETHLRTFSTGSVEARRSQAYTPREYNY